MPMNGHTSGVIGFGSDEKRAESGLARCGTELDRNRRMDEQFGRLKFKND
jgi:hypothetical protein